MQNEITLKKSKQFITFKRGYTRPRRIFPDIFYNNNDDICDGSEKWTVEITGPEYL